MALTLRQKQHVILTAVTMRASLQARRLEYRVQRLAHVINVIDNSDLCVATATLVSTQAAQAFASLLRCEKHELAYYVKEIQHGQ